MGMACLCNLKNDIKARSSCGSCKSDQYLLFDTLIPSIYSKSQSRASIETKRTENKLFSIHM